MPKRTDISIGCLPLVLASAAVCSAQSFPFPTQSRTVHCETIVIKNEAGAPLKTAKVKVSQQWGTPKKNQGSIVVLHSKTVKSTVTASDGSLSLVGLKPGTYNVSVTCEKNASMSFNLAHHLDKCSEDLAPEDPAVN